MIDYQIETKYIESEQIQKILNISIHLVFGLINRINLHLNLVDKLNSLLTICFVIFMFLVCYINRNMDDETDRVYINCSIVENRRTLEQPNTLPLKCLEKNIEMVKLSKSKCYTPKELAKLVLGKKKFEAIKSNIDTYEIDIKSNVYFILTLIIKPGTYKEYNTINRRRYITFLYIK